MGIQPPSDLVFDVMQAADAARARQVTGKLKTLATAPGDFDGALAQAGAVPGPAFAITGPLAFAGGSTTGLRNAHALSQRTTATPVRMAAPTAIGAAPAGSLRKFEGMVLSQFVQSMMPTQAASVFGSGNAGDIWRGMLAEKIGNQVAQAGGIGIAARMAASPALARTLAKA